MCVHFSENTQSQFVPKSCHARKFDLPDKKGQWLDIYTNRRYFWIAFKRKTILLHDRKAVEQRPGRSNCFTGIKTLLFCANSLLKLEEIKMTETAKTEYIWKRNQ